MLRQAAREGTIREVERVLDKLWDKEKDDINEPDEVTYSIIANSYPYNLLQYCLQEGKTALILAAERNHGIVVVSLLESGLNVAIDYQTKVSTLFSYYLSRSSVFRPTGYEAECPALGIQGGT